QCFCPSWRTGFTVREEYHARVLGLNVDIHRWADVLAAGTCLFYLPPRAHSQRLRAREESAANRRERFDLSDDGRPRKPRSPSPPAQRPFCQEDARDRAEGYPPGNLFHW